MTSQGPLGNSWYIDSVTSQDTSQVTALEPLTDLFHMLNDTQVTHMRVGHPDHPS